MTKLNAFLLIEHERTECKFSGQLAFVKLEVLHTLTVYPRKN